MDTHDDLRNKRRKFMMGGVFLGASTASMMISNAASSAVSAANDHYLTVGNGGMFASLHEAVAAAGLLHTNSSNWVVICMLPGVYDLSLEDTELALPDFTELTGVSKYGCIVLGNGNKNIRIHAHTRISNCTIKYTGVGSRSAAIRPQDSVTLSMLGFLDIEGVELDVYSTSKCAVWLTLLDRCYIRNSFIQTSGIGIEVFNGEVFISGTHCRLVGNVPGNTASHHAIRQNLSWSRIWVDGGTWATGYGSPEINGESDANIVMFSVGGNANSRVELNNVWNITRNNSGSNSGITACVNVVTPGAWVRVRGGYFQGEDANRHNYYDLMNSAGGRLEIQGTRYKRLFGNSYSSNGAGVRLITNAVYTPKYNDDGIKLIDSSGNSGGMTVMLSDAGETQIIGAEQVIIRIDNSGNDVIVDGNGKYINGALARKLGSAQYSKMVLRYVGNSIGWLVLHE